MGPVTEHITVQRAGARLHGWLKGEPDQPLIVCLHGATLDHRLFDPQVGPLAANGYQVLTLDLRGHGLSALDARVPITMEDIIEDVIAFLDHLGQYRAIFLGQSFGGFVAQHLARCYPNRVRALGLIGANDVFGFHKALDLWLLRLSVTWFAWWPWEDLKKRSANATAFTPQGRSYCMETMNRLSQAQFVQIWRCVTQVLQPDLDVQLTMPIFLALGQFDHTGKVRESMIRWADETPQTVFYRIPCASHIANYDNPAYFNTAFLKFLKTKGKG